MAGPTEIVSLADVKAHLNITSTDNDTELAGFISAAQDFIEQRIGPVVQRSVTMTVVPDSGLLTVQGPIVSLTSMTAAYGAPGSYDVSALYVDDRLDAITYGYAAGCFRYPVTVTYVAGRDEVPPLVRQAALDYVKWSWETQMGPANPVDLLQGDEFTVTSPATVPYRILQALEPYVRWSTA